MVPPRRQEDDDLLWRNRQLEAEQLLDRMLDAERKRSDESYAVKLVEQVVFGLVSLILLGVAGALIAQVLK